MGIGILACESVVEYVQTAQWRLGMDYPVFVLHYTDTDDPGRMKLQIVQATEKMPKDIGILHASQVLNRHISKGNLRTFP